MLTKLLFCWDLWSGACEFMARVLVFWEFLWIYYFLFGTYVFWYCIGFDFVVSYGCFMDWCGLWEWVKFSMFSRRGWCFDGQYLSMHHSNLWFNRVKNEIFFKYKYGKEVVIQVSLNIWFDVIFQVESSCAQLSQTV